MVVSVRSESGGRSIQLQGRLGRARRASVRRTARVARSGAAIAAACALWCLVVAPLCVSARVELMALVHRHGDRSPIDYIPADAANNAYWPEGPGQLTPIGMQQLHHLGQSLRQRYVEELAMIPGTYSQRFVHVRSTDVDRTLVSAQSVLQGLYPPGTGPRDALGKPGLTTDVLQAVPIHTVPKTQDILLRAYNQGACPRFGQLRHERENNELWAEKRREHAHFVDKVKALSGYENLGIENMWKIHDPLVCDQAHNLTWPPGFDHAIFDESAILANFSLTQMFLGPEQRRLSSGVFIEEIRQRLIAGAAGTSQPGWVPITQQQVPGAPFRTGDIIGPRMWLYSAHDTTVSAVLSGLDLFNKHNPPYGSSVVFELHDLSDQPGFGASDEKWAVRMFFNQGVYHLWDPANIIMVKGCADLCPLSKFLELTASMGLTNPEEACKLVEAPDETLEERLEASGEEFVLVLVLVVFALLGTIIGCAVCKGLKTRPRTGSHEHQRLGDTLGSTTEDHHHDADLEGGGRRVGRKPQGDVGPSAFSIDVSDDDDDVVHHDGIELVTSTHAAGDAALTATPGRDRDVTGVGSAVASTATASDTAVTASSGADAAEAAVSAVQPPMSPSAPGTAGAVL